MVGVCVRVRVCVHVCVCVRARVCVHVCVLYGCRFKESAVFKKLLDDVDAYSSKKLPPSVMRASAACVPRPRADKTCSLLTVAVTSDYGL